MPLYIPLFAAGLLFSPVVVNAADEFCGSTRVVIAASFHNTELSADDASSEPYFHRGSGRRDVAQCA